MTIDKGRFSWFEHTSREPSAARRFYTEVLPWQVQDLPMPGDTYPVIKAGETMLGGFVTLPAGSETSHWRSYLSVEDVDASARKVVEAGGKTLAPAFDVPGVGRIQSVADPQGGAFRLFRSSEGDGPRPEGPGTFNWNELWCKDAPQAVAFYERAFGFTHKVMAMPNGSYFVLSTGETMRCGIMQSPTPELPVHWLPYVHVGDVDTTMRQVKTMGAKIETDPTNVPNVGRFTIVRDLQGARLGLITPSSM